MTEEMDSMVEDLVLDKVPEAWTKLAYPSMRGLASWLINLHSRIE